MRWGDYLTKTVLFVYIRGRVNLRENYMKKSLIAAWVALTLLATPAQAQQEKYLIRELQKMLNYLGYEAGEADGISGSQTRSALDRAATSTGTNFSGKTLKKINAELRKLVSTARMTSGRPKVTDEFALSQSKQHWFNRYLYPIDLDGDNLDELIIAGFESQGQKHSDISASRIAIFAWRGFQLVEVTSDWLNEVENVFFGVGDIATGDFNGDGTVDIFLSAYTDSDKKVDAYVLYNVGGRFERQRIDRAGWQHGAAVGDLNADGISDVFAAGYHGSYALYLGTLDGLQKYKFSSQRYFGGSGAAFGKFLGTSEVLLLLTDNAGRNRSPRLDSNLYRVILDKKRKTAKLELIAHLPHPEFEGREWDHFFSASSRRSHEIRARAIDLNGDRFEDLMIVSTGVYSKTRTGLHLSAIQLIESTSSGFENVTHKRVIGHNYIAGPPYSPVLRDLDGDGDMDILISEQDSHGFADSTDVFLQDENGMFVSIGSDALLSVMPASAHADIATAMRGPNGKMYFVRTQTKRKLGLPTHSLVYAVMAFDKG
ncbi:hypothetical protein FAP39_16775 [Shimia litoralis]|uniref:Peptidoglycan binding-like domain-containing protein n=2 Tax=Shimia litoralis TaxID=420403 RepID=A0A4U7MSV9_9RHOB|nr:hypothetical protein FAP39_16775 [Shimia litoralis]